MATFRKIGILSSGGDAPGMNACIKAVVHRAKEMGIEIIGISNGYAGLINGDLTQLTTQKVANINGEGGTILYSSRCPEFKTEEGMQTAIATCRRNDIDALICIGGDGTFRGATDMTIRGIPSIGIPGTIDNDIVATDYTIGFDTALNTTTYMIDNLRDTCESHNRLDVVEVMGNTCGQIALYSAIASGAVAVAIPELPFDEDAAIKRIADLRKAGKRNMIVVVAEGKKNEDGTKYSETLKMKIPELTGVETKFARLAHTVRGGRPTVRDRVSATRMGIAAVEAIVAGKSNLVICERDTDIETVDISLALAIQKYHHGKLSEEELAKMKKEDREFVKKIVERRRSVTKMLYEAAADICM